MPAPRSDVAASQVLAMRTNPRRTHRRPSFFHLSLLQAASVLDDRRCVASVIRRVRQAAQGSG
jgi:hypothetical protein